MTKKLYSISLLLTVAVFFLTSCHRDLDIAPESTYDGVANLTIAELLEYHVPAANIDTYDTLPKGIVIEGTIISSDEEGNCYKYITIDDGTAGVVIKINSSTLYTNYPLGQHVFVNCDGLVLGDYYKQMQLGWWENGSMQGISTNKLYKHIFKDGLPGPAPEPSFELTSASQIQNNMYNRLVRLKNVHFDQPGLLFASGTSAQDQSRKIVFENGSSITLYTSFYAKFASQPTPAGVFDMTAILSIHASTKQVAIRSLDDIGTPVIVPTFTEVDVYNLDLNLNPLENGWTVQTNAGNSWQYFSNSTTKAIRITGMADVENNSWLISPPINTNGYENLTVSFTHRSFKNFINRDVYYSTTYVDGNPENAVWIPLNGITYSNESTTHTQELPADVLNSNNLRFAFKYHDNTTSSWYVMDFNVSTIVEQ